MLSHYSKLSIITFVVFLRLVMITNAYLPYTETHPMKFDTQFSISLTSSNTILKPGPITRYSDAYEKAIAFFRNQYGLDIAGNGTRLPSGCGLFTGTNSEYVVNYAKVRGFQIVAGSQDVGVHEDSFRIVVSGPIVSNGNYGKNGALIDSNSVLHFGFYTFFWRSNGTVLFPRVIYSGMMPIKVNSNSSMINFQLTSSLFGQGYARGSILQRTNPQNGKLFTTIISSHSYQMSITDFSPKCSVITSEKDIFNEDIVIKWNNVLLSVIRDLKVSAPIASRQLAILHSAIDDSLVDCKNFSSNCSRSTLVSIISHAASRVLKSLYPTQIDCFNAALKSALECNECKEVSIPYLENIGKPGILAADRILKERQDDGSLDFTEYHFSDGFMNYQSHAPNFVRIPLLPHWSTVKPFVIQNASLYDQGPPPPIDSPIFEKDYNETLHFGREDSSVRTQDQRKIALFWADGAGTSTSLGHWLIILQNIIRNQNIKDTFRISTLFKVLTITMADAAIVCWNHKYKYNAFRPITVITERESNEWSPLLSTPAFPEYSSGHSTLSAAASTVLSLLFGSDEISFESVSEGLIHTIRKFTKLSEAAKEAGKSRIYGGIHFEYANQAGFGSGIAIAQTVFHKLCNFTTC
ncbi:predicted protein [Naegleria gruberi]|uniref:Predicted protein n=1 Tax=Naegleria gruberi TaxID=5762 RepID=D2W2B5_NAEGR|nr:uncharacterized protein NAEGRDRAFT_75530 [Naegleria gruberi]EFC36796.1 predicted protein [Naegleria gruberi]|eukprot:XP_002669540.1 predicted protein [Naegleria gruberi strain NEG-M]